MILLVLYNYEPNILYNKTTLAKSCFVWLWNLVSDIKIWGYLRTGCWGEYLNRKEMNWQEVGKSCIVVSFITLAIWHFANWNCQVNGDEMGEACSTYVKRNVYIILIGKSEGKMKLGKPKHRWEDNNKTDLR
jgi:hypothetical protein